MDSSEDHYIFEEANPSSTIFNASRAEQVRASMCKRDEPTEPKSNKSPILGEYASLSDELKAKCDPGNFLEPYDPVKVSTGNEIYLAVLKHQDSNSELKELRRRATQELGVRFSTKKLYDELMDYCNPKNFTGKNYDNEKLSLANKCFPQIAENADDIEKLEEIENEASPLRIYLSELKQQEQEKLAAERKRQREEEMEEQAELDKSIRIVLVIIVIIIMLIIIVGDIGN